MITVAAHKVKQFGAEFYQAAFSAADIDRLVQFEVLGYGPAEGTRGKGRRRSRINWELLEKRIARSEAAFQRPVIRRKIEELQQYYRECQEAGNLPAVPGAVIMISERRLQFTPAGGSRSLGSLQIPEEPGILRALDGQHRLLALHAAAGALKGMEVPAVVFDNLDDRQVVELFVTINAKHTRLNPSHLISLAGRRLYANADQALAHDVIRALNEAEGSPLGGEIRVLGVGRGRVSQAPLAEEMVELLDAVRKMGGEQRAKELREGARRFFLNYFKAIAGVFPKAWAGRKYSIKTGTALRAFIRVSPDVMAAARELKKDPFDAAAIRQAVAPWGGARLGDARFETEGAWRQKQAGGTRGTVEILVRELRDALRSR
ncbi:MAG: DGQHR domain-containing protein [candidate division NC10 bacterium]|nr:DGQHR domain-containing protein [candidate division NC10 bacterium]